MLFFNFMIFIHAVILSSVKDEIDDIKLDVIAEQW